MSRARSYAVDPHTHTRATNQLHDSDSARATHMRHIAHNTIATTKRCCSVAVSHARIRWMMFPRARATRSIALALRAAAHYVGTEQHTHTHDRTHIHQCGHIFPVCRRRSVVVDTDTATTTMLRVSVDRQERCGDTYATHFGRGRMSGDVCACMGAYMCVSCVEMVY